MQTRFDHTIRSLAATLLGLGALIATNTPTFANTFKFTYTGSFSSANALNPAGDPTTFLSGPTPFTAEALFDDTSPNLAAPIGVSGFVAYSPLWATLTLGGHTYDVTTYDQNPVEGVTVAIFDNTTPFGPTHFAAGFLKTRLRTEPDLSETGYLPHQLLVPRTLPQRSSQTTKARAMGLAPTSAASLSPFPSAIARAIPTSSRLATTKNDLRTAHRSIQQNSKQSRSRVVQCGYSQAES